jgi:hypothetical protein
VQRVHLPERVVAQDLEPGVDALGAEDRTDDAADDEEGDRRPEVEATDPLVVRRADPAVRP